MTDTNDLNLFDLGSAGPVLLAADEVGLLAKLAEGPTNAKALAEQLGLDGRATARLLEVLRAYGVLERGGDGYAVSAATRKFADCVPGGLEAMLSLWRQLPAFLRTGAPLHRMDGEQAERAAEYSSAVGVLGELFGAAAARLAERLGPLPRGGRILDVGAGSGVWSLAMLAGDARARATALDLPAVLPNFRARAERLGLSSRVQTLEGDYRGIAMEVQGGWERIVLANVLHLEPGPVAQALVVRCAAALAADGQLVVVDSFPDGSRSSERAHALYALSLAQRTSHGVAHPREQVEGWLQASRLSPEADIALGQLGSSLTALVARAPTRN